MHDISIVIVNYNVSAFLQQCLYSVEKASAQNIDVETFVVDNNSVDDSLQMLKTKFPEVKLIANSENMGFAYACNQAIREASGKYILLLNPDTVIAEDSLLLCHQFMNENKNAGALGVKMIDGKGNFLPESKRSLPNAKSSFYKIFGLSALFPKSKKFGQYQLKYLDKDEIHDIEVLSGAFMFIRKSVLDEIGLLDENFFMYGEDIDLSYRIIKAGYKNYYFPKTTIIHYKGKSTKKASIKYVRIFYNAMLIFANKHYQGKKQFAFRLFISLAIYFRASLALLKRLLTAVYLPVLDFGIILLIYNNIADLWGSYKFDGEHVYSDIFTNIYIPIYIVLWQVSIFYTTKYKLNTKIANLLKGTLLGSIIILVIYSLLPESHRYSRIIIIFGAAITFMVSLLIRYAIRFLIYREKFIFSSVKKNALLISDKENFNSENIAKSLVRHYKICNTIVFSNSNKYKNQLIENLKIHRIETIIFLMKDLSSGNIINTILAVADKNLEFKIMIEDSSSLVGAKSVLDISKMPHFKLNPISQPINRFKKRTLDLSISVIMLLLSPLLFICCNMKKLFTNIWQVIIGKKTWVAYAKDINYSKNELPVLKSGVFEIFNIKNEENYTNEEINKFYAQNYSVITDIIVIFKSLKTM